MTRTDDQPAISLEDLAAKIGAEISIPSGLSRSAEQGRSVTIRGVGTVPKAGPDQITFLTQHRFRDQLATCRAAAVIVNAAMPDVPLVQLISRNPYASMAKASMFFFRRTHEFSAQSPLAFVHPTAKVSPSAVLFPFAFVDARAEVGDNTVLYPHVYIGADARVGRDCVLYASATIMYECIVGDRALIHANAVLGADGFGFAPTATGIEKIPQIGRVVLGNDVEIGPTSTVDRGAFDDTTLADGCKLDSQVHVAHGVQIGANSMLCGQTAIAGSAHIGQRLTMAGHSAIGPGVKLGEGITLGPKAGMIDNIDEKGEYLGFPAVPAGEWRRQVIGLKKLPDLLKTITQLTKRVAQLEQHLPGEAKPK